MLDGDAVGLVNTSASCRSLFTHLVLIPVARICCRVAVTSIDVRFSDNPNPNDSLFSKASKRLLQSVIAHDSGSNFKTSSGRRKSMPSEWMQSAKNKRIKLSISTESAMACDSADKLLRHFRDSFQDFHSMIPTGASSPFMQFVGGGINKVASL